MVVAASSEVDTCLLESFRECASDCSFEMPQMTARGARASLLSDNPSLTTAFGRPSQHDFQRQTSYLQTPLHETRSTAVRRERAADFRGDHYDVLATIRWLDTSCCPTLR